MASREPKEVRHLVGGTFLLPPVCVERVEPQGERLEAMLTRIVRAELRRCGIRPAAPTGPGAWRWDAEADAWVAE